MSDCRECKDFEWCVAHEWCVEHGVCALFTKTQTNSDKIRAMTDEEMADFLDCIIHDWGEGSAYLRGTTTNIDNWLEWLKQEVRE